MTWLAISDGRRNRLAPAADARATDDLVTAGSVVIETTLTPETGANRNLVVFDRKKDWHRRFSVTIALDGRLRACHRQGGAATHAAIDLPAPDRDMRLRLTWSWDAPARLGLLSVEAVDTGALWQTRIDTPLPWPMEDIAALAGGNGSCRLSPALELLAVSDRPKPVGLAPGFLADTPILTESGYRPAADLRKGELVVTARRGLQPVRLIRRRELPCLGFLAPLRLRAPFFGLQRDIEIAPNHRILISGTDAEYLFGTDSVLVEARHLAPITTPPVRRGPPMRHFVQIVLDRSDCVRAAGAWGEVAAITDPGAQPEAALRPVHCRSGHPAAPRNVRAGALMLKPYEAAALMSALSD